MHSYQTRRTQGLSFDVLLERERERDRDCEISLLVLSVSSSTMIISLPFAPEQKRNPQRAGRDQTLTVRPAFCISTQNEQYKRRGHGHLFENRHSKRRSREAWRKQQMKGRVVRRGREDGWKEGRVHWPVELESSFTGQWTRPSFHPTWPCRNTRISLLRSGMKVFAGKSA